LHIFGLEAQGFGLGTKGFSTCSEMKSSGSDVRLALVAKPCLGSANHGEAWPS